MISELIMKHTEVFSVMIKPRMRYMKIGEKNVSA